ncbi:transmembrane protein 210 [Trichosurus vulpecula]|uniref:transmembrane protein 210 n=1 Tax=Trichosurus vulpecula TaxID=9337 RepID=UPI00186B1D40|nr:transmembrane protein 210 [Trichosurus vulpecula]
MFPQLQSPSGLLGNIPYLLLLALSISSAADSVSFDGKHCECGSGISREALTTLLIVLGGVQCELFLSPALVVISIIRNQEGYLDQASLLMNPLSLCIHPIGPLEEAKLSCTRSLLEWTESSQRICY